MSPSAFIELAPTSVIIPEYRQRHKAEPDDILLNSIEKDGVLVPIIVREGNVLVAGERRLRACLALELPLIPVRNFEQLTPEESHRIELQENLARKQLSWQEEVAAVAKYHAMRLQAVPQWTLLGTANELGIAVGSVSRYLAIAEHLEDEAIHKCPTMQGAFNVIVSRAERSRIAAEARGIDLGIALVSDLPPSLPDRATREDKTAALMQHVELTTHIDELVAPTSSALDKALSVIEAGKVAVEKLTSLPEMSIAASVPSVPIHQADFVEWSASYAGPKFDVAHCDFPYGKNYTGANTSRSSKGSLTPIYDDSADTYWTLVNAFLANADNFLHSAAHVIFWFDMMYYQQTIDAFTAKGWKLAQPFPLIWSKDNVGTAADPKRRPRHVYETALLFSRGDRYIARIVTDHISCQLDDKLHLSQKPLRVLEHFLSLVVDQHTAIIDPTCGSGSAITAATRLGVARALGLELDVDNVSVARHLFKRHSGGRGVVGTSGETAGDTGTTTTEGDPDV